MNPSWAGILGVAFGAAAAGLVVWPFAGATWAWAAVGAVLALRVLYHAIHLAALHAWLRRPTLETLPRGRGAWEEALADLHRLFKGRDAEQQQLLRTLARFRAAGRALPDGVVILDRENHIEWANPTAARYFGIDARRDFGQPVTNFVRHPDFVAYLAAGEFADPLVLRSARSDAVLSLRVIEFGDEQKLLNSRDVTAEDRLDTMRRDFVANVSHELKTPVTVLSGFVETLGDESLELLPQQKRRFLGLMAEQARRMQRLVEDLLTLSALESGAAPEDEQPIEVRPLVERLAEEARALSAGRHRIEIAIREDCRLLGSPKELHSALSNLVSNAVRYTPEGGSVRLAWRIEGARGVFSVADTGIGIEPRHMPRLTERFYRVDSGRSRETGGTGLGLAIVKHALTRHQASLEIESELGRGSTFSAVFPAARVLAAGVAKVAA
ncbi:MAG: phosphate regulon sensor histidine kinase PhoR [Betaproteobacteria bacterium RIFCSPHIGHO2_12_FULL_69_13]|nr:MAG: phosphate regulon sensor histidine kinase PhoR [Betaproteobacteria bacterium RIFCSPHIGHO2_12_FULL_69_13]OGA67124.1 MAG: phosphate regulon sensor histidine kinase PhoR [Betaproteobacteria bacterium RIFCSPLOWO2_12_FULL_68_20]